MKKLLITIMALCFCLPSVANSSLSHLLAEEAADETPKPFCVEYPLCKEG